LESLVKSFISNAKAWEYVSCGVVWFFSQSTVNIIEIVFVINISVSDMGIKQKCGRSDSIAIFIILKIIDNILCLMRYKFVLKD
jgi:hypothetical protein